jgi:predicted GH43/DUF377 family glycosyl hydrolase
MPGFRSYNPSIMKFGGKTLMTFRRHGVEGFSRASNGLASYIVACETNQEMTKSFGHRVVSGLVGPNHEDARLFWHNDKPHISYTSASYELGNEWQCMMQCAELDVESMAATSHHDTRFGVNGAATEKNWTYFSFNGMLRFVYNIEPFIVFEVETRKIWYHRHAGEWVFGIPHGGTPPVKAGNRWYSFFHGYRKSDQYHRRYFIGAYAFDDEMRVRAFTPWPIMAGDSSDGFCFELASTPWAPLVTFPCGSIFENNRWTVSVGLNDSFCGIIEISHELLVDALLKEVTS